MLKSCNIYLRSDMITSNYTSSKAITNYFNWLSIL